MHDYNAHHVLYQNWEINGPLVKDSDPIYNVSNLFLHACRK